MRDSYESHVLDFKSEELFYKECVKSCLHRRLGIGYNKSGSGLLVDLVCNGKALFGKELKTGEPRPVKLD